ncbi:phospholipase B1, membrane-associated-like [Pseudomyrmex gracilis]|uniref:phospholipase B1, membrane-associated-like n=1 Tax=Pseudomyrmex gracilis TaxID=219809 RepID=UPI000994A161|nr:phospholipase B1, membrane-associated-like [Pseudomyrmex gracilis]
MCNWRYVCCVLLLYLLARVSAQKTALDSPSNLQLYRVFRNWIYDAFGRTGTEERFLKMSREANKVQNYIPNDNPFPCNVTGGRSSEVPVSVHKLRPGDIDVIAAMGDSLTAGAGIFADNVVQIFIENRGVSATGGGQGTWREYLTIPNILKEYNPNLIGYALSDSLTSHEASQLNVAETGAMSQDMPYMAQILVKRILRDPRIDVQKHWKFISLMIGSNDFCLNMCVTSPPTSVLEKHKDDLLKVLRILRDNLPRTFVALISPPHLKILVATQHEKTPKYCYMTTDIECPCMFGLQYRHMRPLYYEIIEQWQKLEMEIATYPEFQKDDFTVVFQPILMNITVPSTSEGYSDLTYLSADCFHISQKSNAAYAIGLWNNLFEPIGAKSSIFSDSIEQLRCPPMERPYLATTLN